MYYFSRQKKSISTGVNVSTMNNTYSIVIGMIHIYFFPVVDFKRSATCQLYHCSWDSVEIK